MLKEICDKNASIITCFKLMKLYEIGKYFPMFLFGIMIFFDNFIWYVYYNPSNYMTLS